MIRKRKLSELSDLLSQYYTANFTIIEKTRFILYQKLKHVNDYVMSHSVYQFSCVIGSKYIRRSNSDVQVRVSEHVSKWLEKLIKSSNPIVDDKHLSSSTARHIVEIGHKIGHNSVFVVM